MVFYWQNIQLFISNKKSAYIYFWAEYDKFILMTTAKFIATGN